MTEKLRPKRSMSRRHLLGAFAGGLGLSAVTRSGAAARPTLSQNVDLSNGMHVVITGSGSALPDPERGNASQAVIVDGTVLQFDCGRKTMDNLMRAGINPIDVDYILFTHLHFDHIATYDYYIISSWIAGRQQPFQVLGPPGTVEMHRGAIDGMHKVDVKFVTTLVETWPEEMKKRPTPAPPVDVKDVRAGVIVETDKLKVTATETPHITAWGFKSLGYRVDSPYGSVAISGDTAPSQNMIDLAKGCDVLVHEMVIPDVGMTTGGKFSAKSAVRRTEAETERPRTGHTSPSQLGRLAREAGVKKLVPTHLAPYTSVDAAVAMSSLYLGPRQSPDIWDKFTAAIKKEYDGPVILAEDAMVINVG